jgi:hypothetical protein
MLITPNDNSLNSVLEELAKSLDITQAQHDSAVESYEFVAKHLASETSPLAKYSPEILPQGSFLLNTMIRPINQGDELDIDLVCRLDGKAPEWTQFNLKKIVGDRLKDHGVIKPLIKIPDGRRCWTLEYRESLKFHMDILPAIVSTNYKIVLEKAFAETTITDYNALAIRITDNTELNYETSIHPYEWQKSNPFGYGIWFEERATIRFEKAKLMSEAIQPVPKFQKDKYPLQRIIQILKRHRDLMFIGDEHKPISIIITTLAAKAYNKQVNILDALLSIIEKMPLFIEEKHSAKHGRMIKWVTNPVNNQENFADKWTETEEKQRNFYDWLAKLQNDFGNLRVRTDSENYEILESAVGTSTINEAYRNAGLEKAISNIPTYPTSFSTSLLAVPYKQQPIWPMQLTYEVQITGRYKHKGEWKSLTKTIRIPKNCSLLFSATTNVPRPFSVYWQVVNTGDEATGSNKRGEIFPAKTAGTGGLIQKEGSQYTGIHWIQCFIVKDGVCVGKSKEFFVTIE